MGVAYWAVTLLAAIGFLYAGSSKLTNAVDPATHTKLTTDFAKSISCVAAAAAVAEGGRERGGGPMGAERRERGRWGDT